MAFQGVSVHGTVIKDYGSIRFDRDDNRCRAGRWGTIPSIIRVCFAACSSEQRHDSMYGAIRGQQK